MGKIAVIKTGGKQYKIKEKDTLKIEKVLGEKGKKVYFDEILLIADENGKSVDIGAPKVKGAKVEATVLEQGRARKVSVIKYKRKTRYRRNLGHRQAFTKVEINKIAVK